jgi:hypothetical protein
MSAHKYKRAGRRAQSTNLDYATLNKQITKAVARLAPLPRKLQRLNGDTLDYDFALDYTNKVLILTDRCTAGVPSLTNAMDGVLRMIEEEKQVDPRKWLIMYRDSHGVWDGVQWSGHTVLSYSVGESDEKEAFTETINQKRNIMARQKEVGLFKSREEQLIEHLHAIAIRRGLYYGGLRDKVGENLKVFTLHADPEEAKGVWIHTGIQGHTVHVFIAADRFEQLMDGNGLPLEIPKKLLPSSGRGL